MISEKSTPEKEQPGTILSYINDLPNLCSLAGLACTLLAIYCSFLGNYAATMIGMIWAVAFDWADGLIARRMKGRTSQQGLFGGQLDVLIDIVSYGVTPALLLLSIGKFEPVFLFGAFLMMAGAAIRLSYFSTFGLVDGKHYTGLALDNNSIIIVFIYLFAGLFNEETFSYLFYASCLGLTCLNVSQIKIPKLSGNPRNVFILAIYTLGISMVYGWSLY
jgi:phosphatidylserine synthase